MIFFTEKKRPLLEEEADSVSLIKKISCIIYAENTPICIYLVLTVDSFSVLIFLKGLSSDITELGLLLPNLFIVVLL